MLQIKPAEKFKQFARIVFWGIEKSGKTHAALALATLLAGEEGKIGVVSSEYASSRLLKHRFPHDIIDLTELDANGNIAKNAFSAERYEQALKLFIEAGYNVIVIDSFSHFWEGTGGILDAVNSHKNTFNDGWGENSPVYRRVIQTILSARCHILITLRAKDCYIQQEYVKRDGAKSTGPVNVGLAPVMRKQFGYEMHLKIRMDSMIGYVEATGMQDYIPRGEEIEQIDDDFAARLLNALDGVPIPEPTEQQKEIRTLLDEFYSLAPLTFARIANWEQQALRSALALSKGTSIPSDFTDEDVRKMRAYVEKKRAEMQPRVAKVQPQETEAPQEQSVVSTIEPEPEQPISEQQLGSIRKLCEHLGKPEPDGMEKLSFFGARKVIQQLTTEYKEARQKTASQPEAANPVAQGVQASVAAQRTRALDNKLMSENTDEQWAALLDYMQIKEIKTGEHVYQLRKGIDLMIREAAKKQQQPVQATA